MKALCVDGPFRGREYEFEVVRTGFTLRMPCYPPFCYSQSDQQKIQDFTYIAHDYVIDKLDDGRFVAHFCDPDQRQPSD